VFSSSLQQLGEMVLPGTGSEGGRGGDKAWERAAQNQPLSPIIVDHKITFGATMHQALSAHSTITIV
jgi:hypothetical protein